MLRPLACAATLLVASMVGGGAARAETFVVDRDAMVVGQLQVVGAHAEDTLLDVARRSDVGFEELVAANPDVDPWLPAEGTPVVLPTRFILPDVPRVGIVVNIAAKRLFYFPPPRDAQARTVITYPIAIGRPDWETPVGSTTIVAKEEDPVWTVPPAILAEHAREDDPLPRTVPPGPANPLGRYALRLGFDGYLIHGTNKPFGIGMRATHGCMRMYPEDIAALFPQIAVGTPVRIVDDSILAAWDRGDLYVEVHPSGDRIGDAELAVIAAASHAKGAGRPLTRADWEAVLATVAPPRGIPWPVTRTQATELQDSPTPDAPQ